MTSERCRDLPVVDEGRLLRVISTGDLVNWVTTTQDHRIHQLEDYVTGRYPA